MHEAFLKHLAVFKESMPVFPIDYRIEHYDKGINEAIKQLTPTYVFRCIHGASGNLLCIKKGQGKTIMVLPEETPFELTCSIG